MLIPPILPVRWIQGAKKSAGEDLARQRELLAEHEDDLSALEAATDLLIAVLNSEFAEADARRGLRPTSGQRGADIRLPTHDEALQSAAVEWLAVFDPARFPNLRQRALRLLQAVAEDAHAADVVVGGASTNDSGAASLVHHEPFRIPEGTPIVALDATPLPSRWEALPGRRVVIRGRAGPRPALETMDRPEGRNLRLLWSPRWLRL